MGASLDGYREEIAKQFFLPAHIQHDPLLSERAASLLHIQQNMFNALRAIEDGAYTMPEFMNRATGLYTHACAYLDNHLADRERSNTPADPAKLRELYRKVFDTDISGPDWEKAAMVDLMEYCMPDNLHPGDYVKPLLESALFDSYGSSSKRVAPALLAPLKHIAQSFSCDAIASIEKLRKDPAIAVSHAISEGVLHKLRLVESGDLQFKGGEIPSPETFRDTLLSIHRGMLAQMRSTIAERMAEVGAVDVLAQPVKEMRHSYVASIANGNPNRALLLS